MAKELKLKVRKFWGLILTFVEITEEKLVGGIFAHFSILNRVKDKTVSFSNTNTPKKRCMGEKKLSKQKAQKQTEENKIINIKKKRKRKNQKKKIFGYFFKQKKKEKRKKEIGTK